MTGTVEERFWAKVAKSDGCWQWTASKSRGHGQFYLGGGQLVRAHRFAYEILVGPIPEGLTIDHLCRNRGCVNPSHLEPVTSKVNVLRGVCPSAINARKTHCQRGHALTGDNLIVRRGERACRSCERDRRRKWHRQRSPEQRSRKAAYQKAYKARLRCAPE